MAIKKILEDSRVFIEAVYNKEDLHDLVLNGDNLADVLKAARAKKVMPAKRKNELVYMGADLPDEHSQDAKYGWYSYVTRFVLPVYGENENIERYNVFQAIMLVRHAEDGKLYLYDIIKIKKETSNLFQS